MAFLAYTDAASAAVSRALSVCAKSIIPSLFPYMVISSMLINTGAGAVLGNIFAYPVNKLFRLSPESSAPVILGAICGFPIGAVTAVNLYSNGEISKNEAERLLPVSNNTGPAFLIGVIGAVYWNSKAFGLVIYISQIFTSAIIGIISSRKIPYTEYNNTFFSKNKDTYGEKNFLSQLSSSISSSAINMITVCGFVVFFSAIIDLLIPMCEIISPNGYAGVLLASFLEFSSAAKYASLLTHAPAGAALTAFAVGWAGISVHSQVMSFSISSKCNISMKKYFKYKFIQGIICGIVCYFYALITKISPSTGAFAGAVSYSSFMTYSSNIIFLFGSFCYLIKLFPKRIIK